MTSVQSAPAAPRRGTGERGERLAAARGALPLLVLFAVASAVLVHYALEVHTWQPDEVIYVLQGRGLADNFPSALWDTQLFVYGIERLNPLYGAFTSAVFSQTAT